MENIVLKSGAVLMTIGVILIIIATLGVFFTIFVNLFSGNFFRRDTDYQYVPEPFPFIVMASVAGGLIVLAGLAYLVKIYLLS